MVEAESPDTNAGWGGSLVSLAEVQVGRVEPFLLGMAAAVTILLLIAIGNLTNLTMARSVSRRVETAIRRALGADRPVLIRQFLTESVLVALGGWGVGLLLAFGGLKALSSSDLLDLPRVSVINLDPGSILFALGLSLLAGLALGGVSFMASRGMGLSVTLRAGGGGGMGTSRPHKIREFVLAGQVALALILTIGAALLSRSLLELNRVDPGFDPENLMAFSYNLPSASYPDQEAISSFEEEAPVRVIEIAGIEAAGLVTPIPMEMGSVPSSWSLPPELRDPSAGVVTAHMRTVSSGYFPAMGLSLLTGRLLEATDGPDAESVVLVNQSFVDQYLLGEDPLGRRVTAGEPDAEAEDWSTIVGVVEDVKFRSLRAEAQPEIYLPMAQLPTGWGHLVVRSGLPRERVIRRVTETIQTLDPNLPLSDILSGHDIMSRQLRVSRLGAILTTLFGLTSTLMAVVGILGVLSILVAQRLREIGLRMVLGAGANSIWGFVLYRGLRPVGVGMILGIVGAVWATRFLESQIHGVSTLDPAAFLLPILILTLASLLACLVPGARALKADPAKTLNSE
jgi:predicted permease